MQVHRFHNFVAAYVTAGEDKETAYMSAAQARQLARALNKVARSIEKEEFAKSTNLTWQLDSSQMTLAGAWRNLGKEA